MGEVVSFAGVDLSQSERDVPSLMYVCKGEVWESLWAVDDGGFER